MLAVQDLQAGVQVTELSVLDLQVFTLGGENEGWNYPVVGFLVVLGDCLAVVAVQGALVFGFQTVEFLGGVLCGFDEVFDGDCCVADPAVVLPSGSLWL